jgi:hypothetical protein
MAVLRALIRPHAVVPSTSYRVPGSTGLACSTRVLTFSIEYLRVSLDDALLPQDAMDQRNGGRTFADG